MPKKDGFYNSANNFFKRLQNQDLVKVGDNKITTFNQPASKDEVKRRSELSVFRQYLNQKNWSTKHIELFNEYRKMDEQFPIINAALRLYTQEVCGFLDTTKIQLLNGETKTLRELINEGYKDFWAWGYDSEQKKIVPVKCEKAISKGFKEVVEIKLDDGTILEFTPDHKFLLTSGVWKEAKDLLLGDSLQSIYTKVNDKGYLELSDGQTCKNNKKKLKWKKAHSIVANEVNFLKEQKKYLDKTKYESKRNNTPVCHHSSFNKLNNDPNHLQWMLWEDHRKLHEDRYDICLRWENLSEKDKQKRIETNREIARKLWSNPEKAAKKASNHSRKMKDYFASLTETERLTKHVKPFNENHNWWNRNTSGKNNPNADTSKTFFEDFTIEELDEILSWYCSKEIFINDYNCSKNVLSKYLKLKNIDFRFLGYKKASTLLKTALIEGEICNSSEFKSFLSNKGIKGFNLKTFGFFLKRNGYTNGVKQFEAQSKTNHKIVSITFNKEIKEVGDIVNAGDVHNFAIMCNEGMIIAHNCLSGDIKLHTPMGDKTIKELYDLGKSRDMFYVHCMDFKWRRTQWGLAKYIKYNGKKVVYEVVVERNLDEDTAKLDSIEFAKFKCTDNHKIMLPDGNFKMLSELNVGDKIFSFYKSIDPSCKCKVDNFQSSRILSITSMGEEDVYDLVNVEPNSHFSIKLTDTFYVEVHNCTKDDMGNIIKIHSNDKEIKKSLEDCFFRNLKINSQGNLLVKSMLQFGNLYCYQMVRKGEGVTDLIYLPPEAIRIELLSNAAQLDDFKYNWFGQSSGGLQFEPWELVHFRNIEDIEMQPYGTSILRSIVDTWRRIVLMREALIIYRVTRAPQRYLFKIDTTGLDPDAALLFAEEIKKQLYKKPMVNPFTGEIDFKYNPLPHASYTPVKTLDNRILTLKELAEEYEQGKKNYVYSIKDDTHEIVAGEVKWCGKNYTANKLVRIWLDNDTFIDAAPEHPLINRKGEKVRADELEVGESLMPFYLSEEKIRIDKKTTYETIYNPATGRYQFTHKLIAEEVPKEDESFRTRHHIDFNRYNNRPDNLRWMNNKDHFTLHAELGRETITKYNKSPEKYGKVAKMQATQKAMLANGTISFKGSKNANYKGFADSVEILNALEGKMFKNFEECLSYIKIIFPKNKQHFYLMQIATHLKITIQDFANKYLENSHKINFNQIIEKQKKKDDPVYLNHKIKRIEILNDVSEDVYCMTIVGPNNSNDRHNFAILGLNLDKTPSVSGCFTGNSIEENFYMPTFEGDVGGIDTLQGACLKGDTEILTNNGNIKIKDLCDNWKDGQKTFVLSCNKYGYITPGRILKAWATKEVTTLYKIEVNNSNIIETTDNHPFLLDSMEYKQAKELIIGEKLKGMYDEDYIVTNIEIVELSHPEIVYDIEVDEYHNFALASGIFVHNSNLGDIEDYKVIKDDLFAGLLIPKSYLTFEEDLSNKAALAQEDMRFAGAVRQYQGNFVEGLLHIATVHLHTQGFSKEDLGNFEIEMNTNSKLVKKLENETLQQQIDLAKSILDTSNGELTLMSFTDVLKNVMHFSDEQIAKTFEDQLIEKKIMWRMSQLKENGFYDEPEQSKKEEMLKRLGDDDIFSNLKFEHAATLNTVEKILTEKVKDEVKRLSTPIKLSPTKKQINALIDLNPQMSELEKTQKILGLRG